MIRTGRYLSTKVTADFRGRRVLVTGASGFVGGHIARQGVAGGVEVFAMGRRPGPAGTIFCEADLCDPGAVRAAVQAARPEAILHFASPGVAYGTADFGTIVAALVTGGEALLAAACDLELPPHFVQIGSGLEYAAQDRPIMETDPIVPSCSPYGAAKAAAAAVLGGYAGRLPITLLRPFNLYGAGDTAPRIGGQIVDAALLGESFALSAGEQLRDFLHVDDFGALVWEVAAQARSRCEFAVLNAGSGVPRPLRDYCTGIGSALQAAGVACALELGAKPYRQDEPMMAIPDLTRLFGAVRWRPQIDLSAGIADFVDWRLGR